MKNRHVRAFISSALSIIPMIAIIFILHFSGLAKITSGGDNTNIWLILVGTVFLISGLALFQIGASSSLAKVGEYMGASLSKQKNLFIVILFSFTLGLLITCAEPSILIVSKQVTIVPGPANALLLVGGIGLGVGVFVVVGVLRVFYHKPLKLWYIFFYGITFMLISLIGIDPARKAMLPFIFDAGGVTTGSATVPFILALGAGVATVRGGKNATNDSFGLVGMSSVGPIISTALLILINSSKQPYVIASSSMTIFERFLDAFIPSSSGFGCSIEVLIAIAPILIIFFVYNFIYIKLPKTKVIKLLIGFAYAYVGLAIFLAATSAAMSPVGSIVGQNLALQNNWVIIAVAFVIGLVTITCEPAVHVLTKQIEGVSDERITKLTVLLTLSIGVGFAIGLAALRAVFQFSVLYIIVPGYVVVLALSFFTPDIYTAIAFDSGGTASGPMSASFVLPMIIGIVAKRSGYFDGAEIMAVTDNIYEFGFGVVAMIAMTPIIAIQILGIAQQVKSGKAFNVMRRHVYSIEDAQIINF